MAASRSLNTNFNSLMLFRGNKNYSDLQPKHGLCALSLFLQDRTKLRGVWTRMKTCCQFTCVDEQTGFHKHLMRCMFRGKVRNCGDRS